MNAEQPTPEQPNPEASSSEAQQVETNAPKPQGTDPRRRLRELLAIPERNRTDAIWDELIELEIQTAPGNRAQQPQQVNAGQGQEQGRRPDQVRRQQQGPGGQPSKNSNNRRRQGARRGPPKPVT